MVAALLQALSLLPCLAQPSIGTETISIQYAPRFSRGTRVKTDFAQSCTRRLTFLSLTRAEEGASKRTTLTLTFSIINMQIRVGPPRAAPGAGKGK